MTLKRTAIYAALTPVLLTGLAACGGSDQADLRVWMQEQRKKTPTTVEPINPPIEFVAAPYTQAGLIEPFDSTKLKSAIAKARAAGGNGIQPDLSRKREALEAFPIDAMRMVGYVLKQGKPIAMIATATGLYNVSAGQYLGQDFGKVVSISEQEISLKELVQDGSGVWTERLTKLPLVVAGKEIKK